MAGFAFQNRTPMKKLLRPRSIGQTNTHTRFQKTIIHAEREREKSAPSVENPFEKRGARGFKKTRENDVERFKSLRKPCIPGIACSVRGSTASTHGAPVLKPQRLSFLLKCPCYFSSSNLARSKGHPFQTSRLSAECQ